MDDLIERLRTAARNPYDMTDEQGRADLIREAAAALEAAREAAAYMRNQVKWEPCDCGCPLLAPPKTPELSRGSVLRPWLTGQFQAGGTNEGPQ